MDNLFVALFEILSFGAIVVLVVLGLGIIASTDTHNGTPGAVDEAGFVGHRGIDDDTPAKQLGNGVLTPGGIQFSPGGIAGVWAEENSRASIFDGLRRRGLTAELVTTGQTGWLQGHRYGFILDATPNDFVTGELERHVGDAVHGIGQGDAVPVDRRRFRQLVVKRNAQALPFPDAQCWSRR